MDLKAGVTLIPPDLKNFSCMHSRYTGYSFIYHIGFIETIEAFLILILTLGIVGANAIVIFVINNRRYVSYIPQQPRYLLTSLALNDLTIGLLITPFGMIPALFKCWPYGEIFCQIQALLRGALSQQSAVILICMAIDRYMCALYPRRYQQHLSKKGCVAVLSLTWIINLTVFGLLVLPKGYYFNNTGLMACEPFHSKPSYRILATCSLYFPTTMVLMYCYGLSFHLSRFRLIADPTPPTATSSQTSLNTTVKKMTLEERHMSASTSRSMAAISLGFIVMVTPWTIQEIVTACTGSKLPIFLDFLVTWTALSNSFWNPFLYWLLNSHFRRLSRILLSIQRYPHEQGPHHKEHCCNISSECDPIPTIPFPPQTRLHSHSVRSTVDSNIGAAPYYLTIRPDIEGLSEKYWGEILERTLSSGSLYTLQKSFSSSQQCKQHEPLSFTKTSDLSSSMQCEQHSDDDDDGDDDDDDNDNDDDDNADNNSVDNGEDENYDEKHYNQQPQFLNTELKFCEHIYHDVSCAKNKTSEIFGNNCFDDVI